jgi:hypothetical protein
VGDDATLQVAHICLGQVETHQGRWEDASASFDWAIAVSRKLCGEVAALIAPGVVENRLARVVPHGAIGHHHEYRAVRERCTGLTEAAASLA